MDIPDVDDPSYVVPRVMNVDATLLRLGLTPCRLRRHGFFYRRFVPLYAPVLVPMVSRCISHVNLTVFTDVDHDFPLLRIYAGYGYPERHRKKLKIIDGFRHLISETTTTNFTLSEDSTLLRVERMLRRLMDRLSGARLECARERDTDHGVVKVTLREHEALIEAVRATLEYSRGTERETEWWDLQPEREDEPRAANKIIPANKYSRLPNFDRRGHLRRVVRRPV